jgi:hypothetical protein
LQAVKFNRVRVGIALWLLAITIAGIYRVFDNFPSFVLGVCVVATTILLITFHTLSANLQRITNPFSLKDITLFHSIRIIAGISFFIYREDIPDLFFNRAAYGDIFSGLLALSVLFFHRFKLFYIAFNIIGLLDIINAFRSAIVLSFSGNEQIRALSHLPLIYIILFLVPAFLFAHYLAFRRIFKSQPI